MKKTTLAIIVGALAVASTANANWYAQGDLGYSKVRFSGDLGRLDDNKFDPRISVGYDFGDWRLAGDYTYTGKFYGTKIYGFGLSAIYDFPVNSPIQPYVGVRIAQNVFDYSYNNRGAFRDDEDYKFGFGALAGAQYRIAPNWSLNGGVEYNRLGKFDDTKVNQYGVKVGIRYDF